MTTPPPPRAEVFAELATQLEAAAKTLRTLSGGADQATGPRPPFCKGGPVTSEHIARCPALHTRGVQ